MTNPKEEFEKKLYDALGLETDPNGQDGMYLIRDERGKIMWGIDFTDERKEIMDNFEAAHKSYLSSLIEDCEGMKRKRCEKAGYGHEHNPWGCQPDKPCAFCDHMESRSRGRA